MVKDVRDKRRLDPDTKPSNALSGTGVHYVLRDTVDTSLGPYLILQPTDTAMDSHRTRHYMPAMIETSAPLLLHACMPSSTTGLPLHTEPLSFPDTRTSHQGGRWSTNGLLTCSVFDRVP